MPPVSQAQRRWAYAAAEGKVPGVSRAVGREFEGHGVKGLPETVHGPFHKVKGRAHDHATPSGVKRKPRPDPGQNGHGAPQGLNAGGFRGQGNTSPKGQYHSSMP